MTVADIVWLWAGIGSCGQIASVPKRYAWHDLLVSGAAVYVTPDNLKKYNELIEVSLALNLLTVYLALKLWMVLDHVAELSRKRKPEVEQLIIVSTHLWLITCCTFFF